MSYLKKVLQNSGEFWSHKQSINETASGFRYVYDHVGTPERYPCLVISVWHEPGHGAGSGHYEHNFVYADMSGDLEDLSPLVDEEDLENLNRARLQAIGFEQGKVCFFSSCRRRENSGLTFFICKDAEVVLCENHKHKNDIPCCVPLEFPKKEEGTNVFTYICHWHGCTDASTYYCKTANSRYCDIHRHHVGGKSAACCVRFIGNEEGLRCQQGCMGGFSFYRCEKTHDLYCVFHKHTSSCCVLVIDKRRDSTIMESYPPMIAGGGVSRITCRCGRAMWAAGYFCKRELTYLCAMDYHLDSECCVYMRVEAPEAGSVKVVDKRDEEEFPIPWGSRLLPEVQFTSEEAKGEEKKEPAEGQKAL